VILNELTLINFGIYKGEHKVSLTPENKKPIILFGAYNGSGKTTFLDALQLVLYGKSAKTSGRSKMAYEEYLRILINRDISPKIGAGLSLSFSTIQNGKNETIEISRTWAEIGSSVKEHCVVKRNGTFDESTSDRWSEFVEEFMPSAISELFFFDGEKIEGLADPATSSNFIRSGIYSLLGINSIESLIKSLTQIEKRKAIEITSNSDKHPLDDEEKNIAALDQKFAEIDQEKSRLKVELDAISKKVVASNEAMKISGAELFDKRYELQEKLSVLNEQMKNINSELIELAASKAPLILLRDSLLNIGNELKKRSGHNLKSLDLFKQEVKLIKEKFPKNVQSEVIKALDERIDVLHNEAMKNALEIEPSNIPTAEELNDLQALILKKIKQSEKIDEDIDNVNKNLMAVPSEEKIKDIVIELNKNQSEETKLHLKYEFLSDLLSKILIDKEKIKKEVDIKLQAIANQETELIISQRILKHAQKSKETLTKFKEQLINKNLFALGDEISNCFKILQRKSTFDLKFEINSKNFSLIIKKNGAEEVSAKTLSAGERQLLAVSILWALAKSSGKVLPTVIDTPLGRLDMPHREKLISNYFPKASKQVLIFATDAEISNKQYLSLKPYISREFTIDYDETTESSKFVNNYFESESV